MARKITVLGAVVVVSIALVIVHAWAEPQMNPGKWEITTTTEMEGMPPQSKTHTKCITADDMVPMSEDANQECQVTDITTQGNTVSWRISCGGGKMNGTGSVTYSGDSMNGTMNMTVEPYGTKIKNTLSGQRIGACDGQAATATSQTATQAPQESSEIQETITEDVKDVGKTAKDEAKQGIIDEVRKEVREALKDLFE
jgi:hypothetical protein